RDADASARLSAACASITHAGILDGDGRRRSSHSGDVSSGVVAAGVSTGLTEIFPLARSASEGFSPSLALRASGKIVMQGVLVMTANRRNFLKTSLTGAGLVTWGLNAPGFLSRTAAAAPAAGKPGAKDTILVVIELTGGNDGLNTVIPFKDPEYAKLRPTLRQPEAQIKKINDHLGLHPSLTGLAELLEDHALSIVQGVGYPNPNQSHFRSMDIWQTASLAKDVNEGWLGKALKGIPGAPSFHIKNNNEPSPLALDGAPARVPSIKTLEEFQLQMAAASGA